MSYEIATDIRERLEAGVDEGFYQSEDDELRDAMDALDLIEQGYLLRWMLVVLELLGEMPIHRRSAPPQAAN